MENRARRDAAAVVSSEIPVCDTGFMHAGTFDRDPFGEGFWMCCSVLQMVGVTAHKCAHILTV